MSSYVANAYIRVQPDTKGFETQLRSELRTAVTKVGPQAIRLTVNPAGLQQDVRKKVRAAIASSGTHFVPVTPQLTTFKSGFAKELRADPILIPVVPDMKPFITELRTRVAAANKGLRVTIPVVTEEGGRTQRGAGAAGGGGGRDVSVLRSIARARSDAQERMKTALNETRGALKEVIPLEERLNAVQQARLGIEKTLVKTSDELAFARREGNKELSRTLNIRKEELSSDLAFIQNQERSLKGIAGITDEKKKESVVTKAQTDSEKELLNIRSKIDESGRIRLAAQSAQISSAEKFQRLQAATIPIQQSLEKTTAILGDKTRTLTVAERGRITGLQGQALAEGKVLANQRFSILQTDAQTAGLAVNIKALKSLAEVTKITSSLKAIDTRLEQEAKVARDLGSLSIVRKINALRGEIAAQLELAAARKVAIREEARQVSRQKLLARGAGATGLSLFGVRGATLAASSAFLVGAAAVAAFAKAVQSATGLEQEINVFGETAGATAAQMKLAGQEAVRLGADITLPAVNAADAAQAFSELAKAGLDVENSLSGARGVLQLATAANIENAEATQLVASALNAFGLAGSDSVKVADLLTGAANAAQGSISDMGVAMQQASAVARLAGISLEDTVAFLTLLARNGLRGSDAGTSLRTALTRLIRPTDQAAKLIKNLGINLRDLQGNIRADIFQQFTEALARFDKATSDKVLAEIFGQDALRAAAILGREGAAGLDQVREATQEAGLAARLAGARTKGFGGQVEALKNSVETMGTVIGAAFIGPLGGVIDSLERATSGLQESQSAANLFGGSLEGMSGAVRGFATLWTTQMKIALTVLSPLIAGVGELGRAFGNLGRDAQTGIVGAFVAFKIIRNIDWLLLATRISIVGDSLKSLIVFLRASTASANGLAVAMLRLRTAFIAFARSPAGIALAAAAAAGALLFFATRASGAEKASTRLTEATDKLLDSLEALNASRQTRRGAESDVSRGEIDVIESRIGVRQARNALAGSTAAKGSAERIRLELNLRAALLARADAETRLNEALKQASLARDEEEQNTRNLRDARTEEAKATFNLFKQAKKLASIKVRGVEGREVTAAIQAARANDIFIASLRKRARENNKVNTEESRGLAQRQLLLARFIQQTGEIPTQKTISIVLNSGSALAAAQKLAQEFGVSGDKAVKLFVERLLTGLQGLPVDIGDNLRDPMVDAFARMGDDSGDAFADAFGRAVLNKIPDAVVKPLRIGIPLTLETQIQVAEAEGNEAEVFRLLRARQRRQADFLRKQQARPQDAKQQKLTQQAANNLAQTNSQIQGILDKQRGDAEKARNDQIKARNDADKAVLDALDLKERRLQNKLLKNQLTETLKDDLQTQILIRNFWRETIQRIKATIQDAKTRADALLNARRNLLSAKKDVSETRKDMAEAIKEQRAERQAEIRRAIELNVDFFNTTGNVRAEIRARLNLIKQLKREQALVKKGSNEWRELRNQIAQEQKAIEELRKQTNDRNKAFSQLAFMFLQTQQGFAANLLGNLIPQNAMAGLGTPAGGISSNIKSGAGGPGAAGFGGGLGGALIQQAGLASGRQGPSGGQMSELIEVNRQMLALLSRIAGDAKHPEAKRSKMSSRAMLDMLGP